MRFDDGRVHDGTGQRVPAHDAERVFPPTLTTPGVGPSTRCSRSTNRRATQGRPPAICPIFGHMIDERPAGGRRVTPHAPTLSRSLERVRGTVPACTRLRPCSRLNSRRRQRARMPAASRRTERSTASSATISRRYSRVPAITPTGSSATTGNERSDQATRPEGGSTAKLSRRSSRRSARRLRRSQASRSASLTSASRGFS